MPDSLPLAAHEAPAAAAVQQRIRDGLRQHNGLPSAGLVMGRLARLLQSETDAVQELSNLILADVALTQRLLRLANTIHYRVATPPVTTVTRAIMLLGFDQVRLTAMSLVLLDGLFGAQAAARLRADFHQAIMASALARELMGTRGDEAEEAGIAAMFRCVGRLLLAVFAPEVTDAVRAAVRAGEGAESIVARRLAGHSYEELTELALTEWNLPERICAAVAPLPPRIDAPADGRERVRVSSQFASELAGALRHTAHVQDAELGRLLARYQPALGLDRAEVERLVQTAAERARSVEVACGLKPSRWLLQSEPAVEEAIPAAAVLAPAATEPSVERDSLGRPTNARQVLLAGLADATDALARGIDGPAGVQDVVRIVLECMYTGLGYARTAFVLRDCGANVYRTRASFGQPAPRFAFAASGGADLFHAALDKAADLHLADVDVEKIRACMPDWFARDFGRTRSLLLMPVVANGKALGFFYADRSVVDPRGLSGEELNLLRTLRNQVLLAFRSRSAAGSS